MKALGLFLQNLKQKKTTKVHREMSQNNNYLPYNPQIEGDDEEAILDAYLDKIKNEYKDTWTEENWEEVNTLFSRCLSELQ